MPKHELKAIDTVIAAAKHIGSSRETEYQIAGHPGLQLIVQRTGAKAWRFRYAMTVSGKRVQRKIALGA